MVYDDENIDEEAFIAEIDAAYAAGKMRPITPEKAAEIGEAARQALAQLKAEERKAAKKQAALVNA